MGWRAKKFRFADCQSVSALAVRVLTQSRAHLAHNPAYPCFEGLDGAVGGRRFLEVFVLSCSAHHNVSVETLCKQPKVRSCSRVNTQTLSSY